MKFWDAHLHLQDPRFDSDRNCVLERAAVAGVARLTVNATREEDWDAVALLAASRPEVFPCYGIHPWHVSSLTAGWLERLEERLCSVPSGVGEIGLDRGVAGWDDSIQERVFLAQLALAVRLKRPVTLHCVKAWGRLLALLQQAELPPGGFLLHAWGGGPEMVEPFLRLGARFSFSAHCLAPDRTRARKSMLRVPRERVLVETDAPASTLPSHLPGSDRARPLPVTPSSRGEPGDLPVILTGLASLRGESGSSLADLVYVTTEAFFRVG